MANTIYIDANRKNALVKGETTNNEYVYKLNTELLLPKGTSIQCQNSFINSKGITGGSIEIEDDIIEEISFYYYITETYNPTPISHHDPKGGTWFRSGINIQYSNFRLGLKLDPAEDPDNFILGGEVIKLSQSDDMPNEIPADLEAVHYDYFKATGGSSMPLPECEFVNEYIRPKIRTHKIKIPKGIYGISQLGQLIEDQINGVRFYDETTGDVTNTDSNQREINNQTYDGQPKNSPALVYSDLHPRDFQIINTIPTKDCFINMFDYNQLMSDWKKTGNFEGGYNGNFYKWQEWSIRRQCYVQVLNFDSGNNVDPDTPYNLGGYTPYTGGTVKNQRLIGTNNFKFQYDLQKNGYVIEGLHQQIRCPSHDRLGGRLTNAGMPIIYFKKIADLYRTVVNPTTGETNYGSEAFTKTTSCLNTPITRSGGIAIINWGKSTAEKEGDKQPEFNGEAFRFGEYFSDETKAKTAWRKTIWSRLGFTYDQIQNNKKFHKTQVWNKYSDVLEYGFTTDTTIDPSIVPTISTTNNPIQYGGADGDKQPATEGVQLFNNENCAFSRTGVDTVTANMFSNSLLTDTCMYPVVVSDVGGITAQNLPTLTTNSYYLITSDILDNFKDNVKKGDVLPLLAVVPKTNLSNEDFIVSENQIVQVLSQDKVINKIKIKILNPDLTAPQLDENSSVILKITLPNITPSSLLPPKIQLQLEQENISF